MWRALQHGIVEGNAAARLADDATSARTLRSDFFWSRMLRIYKPASYNSSRTVQLKGKKLHYRFNRGDLQSLREIFMEDVYRCELPGRPKTILDLGGNIGLASVWLADEHQPDQIIAVEPVPENAEVAGRNFLSNGLRGEVIRAAVGLQGGESWFQSRNESNLGQLATNEVEGALKVKVIGIHEVLERFPTAQVDLVKMDIEGGEASLLGSDVSWLQQINSLLVEWHDDRTDSRPLIANVINAGFKHWRINEARQDNLSAFTRL
jgi:FkbM family methyltransferase